MAFGLIFGIFLLLGGSMGLPMGMPPGPEDPTMSKLAPDECLIYASWSSVAEIDPTANQSEKWMSQPKTSKLIPKLRRSYLGYLDKKYGQSNDPVFRHVFQIMSKVIEAGSENATAIYLDQLDLKPENLKATGVLVVNLGDHKDAVVTQMNALHKAFEEMKPRDLKFRSYQPFDFDGQKAIKIFSGIENMPIYATVYQGYFVLGFGDESVEKVVANMKTPQPKWLAELRERNKVDRIASVGYVSRKLIKHFDQSWHYDSIWEFPSALLLETRLFDGIESAGWVCGLDSKGYISLCEIKAAPNSDNIFSLIDHKTIPKRDLKHIPNDVTVAVASRLSTEKIMELIKDSMKQNSSEELYEDVMSQFQDISGLSLEEDLLNSVGSFAYIHYKFDLQKIMGPASNQGWVISVKIKDEMSFPDYLNQINKGVKKWARGSQRFEYDTKKFKHYEIHFLESESNWNTFAWTMIDDDWVFACTPEEIISHIKSRGKENKYLTRETVQSIYEHGDKAGFGAPISVMHLDLADILNQATIFIDPQLDSDSRIYSDMDLKFSDIPKVAELVNGTIPHYLAIFKTDVGYQLYQRQTYPGGSPPATLAAMGVASIPTQMGLTTVKKQMHSIGQAHLDFEKKHGQFCGSFSTDGAGKPLLSWRVHLLPYLGHQDLYEKFRLNEAWDSEHNNKLIEQMPAIYGHPGMNLEKGKTAFLVPTEKSNVFGAGVTTGTKTPLGLKVEEITDPKSETAMLLEVNKDNSVTWTQPKDFSKGFDGLQSSMYKIRDSRKFVAVMCDGSARSLSCFLQRRMAEGILDRADGKKVKLPSRFGL